MSAQRTRPEQVASHGPGPGTGATADLLVVAVAAFALEIRGIAEGDEQVAAAVDIDKAAIPEISRALWHELARSDIAGMGDIDKGARAIQRTVEQITSRVGFIRLVARDVSPGIHRLQRVPFVRPTTRVCAARAATAMHIARAGQLPHHRL